MVTASDLDIGPLLAPLEIPGVTLTPRPLLAQGAVRFVGEPIAAIVADSNYVAEDAAELIGLELDPLPPISCVDDALAEAPRRSAATRPASSTRRRSAAATSRRPWPPRP